MLVLKALKEKSDTATPSAQRKPHPDSFIQIDATPRVAGGEYQIRPLHGAIDDATGQVVGLFPDTE